APLRPWAAADPRQPRRRGARLRARPRRRSPARPRRRPGAHGVVRHGWTERGTGAGARGAVTSTLETVQRLGRETLARPDDYEARAEHLLFYELAFTSRGLVDPLVGRGDKVG